MASSKEMQQSSRPLTLQRLSISSPSSAAVPSRQAHTRNSSQSLLSSSFNVNHRITRRKSVTNSASNVIALSAAVIHGEQTAAIPIVSGGRRSTLSKALAKTVLVDSLPSPPASLPTHKTMPEVKTELHGSAIDDGNDASADEANTEHIRTRRASDSQSLSKESKKGSRIEVRCDKCGKSYKHSSCLTKHLWEHTPEWSFTSKLLISKHQQVQLLEAASVLVAMNGKESSATPPESTKDSASEPDSAWSPDASAYFEQADRQSSADTTPPPMLGDSFFHHLEYRDGNGIDCSKSYQSAVSDSLSQGILHGHLSCDRGPLSSDTTQVGEDDHGLVAAVELLSCSFNSNKGSQHTVKLPLDAPPVPPVPAQYRDQATSLSSAGFLNSFPGRQPLSDIRGLRRGSEDVKMEDSDEDFDMQSKARSDEDDDHGVFGHMEE